MSTKCSLKYGDGFHLYYDLMDSIGKAPDFKAPVYLEVSGGSLETYATADNGNTTTLGIPLDIAIALGLVPPEPAEAT